MSLLDALEYTISDPDAGSPSTDAVLGRMKPTVVWVKTTQVY
jgi:hypothetical protein